jgi:hypothetical protein
MYAYLHRAVFHARETQGIVKILCIRRIDRKREHVTHIPAPQNFLLVYHNEV